MNFLQTSDVWEKISRVDADLHQALLGKVETAEVPKEPARDVSVVPVRFHPKKPSLSGVEGQGRLLHDLASIELQALELGMRTLVEFSQAPEAFRQELAEITRGEARHLKLCLEGLMDLGVAWGTWPVHLGLWHATRTEDSWIDRIFIVHRYLEGAGLDAGDSILRRLGGVEARVVKSVVGTIVREEVEHVDFGSRWYRDACRLEGLAPQDDFASRLWRLKELLPRRVEAVSHDLRRAAGFSEGELASLELLRRHQLAGTTSRSPSIS